MFHNNSVDSRKIVVVDLFFLGSKFYSLHSISFCNKPLSLFLPDRQTLPAAVRGREGGDHDQEAAEARRDERPLRRQRGDYQEAPGPLLQSHRTRHRLLRESRHRQKGRCGFELLPRLYFSFTFVDTGVTVLSVALLQVDSELPVEEVFSQVCKAIDAL